MTPFRFDLFIFALVFAGIAIGAIYAFMLAVPRNDDEHLHDALSPPDHMKTRLLRRLVEIRRRWFR